MLVVGLESRRMESLGVGGERGGLVVPLERRWPWVLHRRAKSRTSHFAYCAGTLRYSSWLLILVSVEASAGEHYGAVDVPRCRRSVGSAVFVCCHGCCDLGEPALGIRIVNTIAPLPVRLTRRLVWWLLLHGDQQY